MAFFHELKKLVDGLKQRRSGQPGAAAPIPAEASELFPPPPIPPPSTLTGHTATGSEEKLTPGSPPQAEGKETISMGSGT